MPAFGNPFKGNSLDRKLTKEETLRAVRFVLAAELEAIQMYRQIAEATEDEKARKVLLDVANEEVVHAGEFQALADALSPADAKLIVDGVNEAKETMGKLSDVVRQAACSLDEQYA